MIAVERVAAENVGENVNSIITLEILLTQKAVKCFDAVIEAATALEIGQEHVVSNTVGRLCELLHVSDTVPFHANPWKNDNGFTVLT